MRCKLSGESRVATRPANPRPRPIGFVDRHPNLRCLSPNPRAEAGRQDEPCGKLRVWAYLALLRLETKLVIRVTSLLPLVNIQSQSSS